MSSDFRQGLEHHQIAIYFFAITAGAILGLTLPAQNMMGAAITPALAVMLFLTFLQVPLVGKPPRRLRLRFIVALLVGNFLLIPLLVWALSSFLPDDPLVRLGVMLVLLTPCIDYVITFSYLGKADTPLLLTATPALLLVQMALLPVYLSFFLGVAATNIALLEPFVHAFTFLILVPLGMATLLQRCSLRWQCAAHITHTLGVLPVPATALVLFVVVGAAIPQLEATSTIVLGVAPIYMLYAVCAPLVGWTTACLFRLDTGAARAVAFSCGTRNSLVVLPLALSVPGAMPLLPAVIVSQTMVELVAALLYIRLIPRLRRHI